MLRNVLVQHSKRCCWRKLHYIVQKDTDKMVPANEVFIRTPNTAPVLTCLTYKECARKLGDMTPAELVTGTFVINATKDKKQMRKVRGVTILPSKLKEVAVLAICDPDQHPEAYNSGAEFCIAPQDIGQVTPKLLGNYDTVVCTAKAYPALASVARVLKQKMPHERKGTVSSNIGSAVKSSMQVVEWEMSDSPNHPAYYNVTVPLIKSDYPATTIEDHVSLLFNDIIKHKPAKYKPDEFIERVELEWTGGKIHLDIREQIGKLKSSEVVVLKKRYTREETWALREKAREKEETLLEETEKISNFLEDRWKKIAETT